MKYFFIIRPLFLYTTEVQYYWIAVQDISFSCVLCFSQILDKLLDRESQTHKPQTLSSFYSSKPAAGSQRSPSKHAATSHSGVGGSAGGVSKQGSSSSSAASLAAPSSSSSIVALAGEDVADLKPVQNSSAGEGSMMRSQFFSTILVLQYQGSWWDPPPSTLLLQ